MMASRRQGSAKNRARTYRVSTGTLPYQITRYCDQKKYIQTIEVVKTSLARSCISWGGSTQPGRPALHAPPRITRNANDEYSMPTTKYPPRRPLNQCGSSDM